MNDQKCQNPECKRNTSGPPILIGLKLKSEHYCFEHGKDRTKEILGTLTKDRIDIIKKILAHESYQYLIRNLEIENYKPEFAHFVENNTFWIRRVYHEIIESI